jgi:hypothetical protein
MRAFDIRAGCTSSEERQMRTKNLVRTSIVFALATVLLSSCSLLAAPQGRWAVKVTAATTAEEWETFYVDAGSTNYMIVVTIEYKNLGKEAVSFSPESVVLVYTGTEQTGWGQTPALHKSGGSTIVTEFKTDSVMYLIATGEARVDTFVYEFPRGYTEFTLYFPETPAVVLTLS